jgi:hypothetical protein
MKLNKQLMHIDPRFTGRFTVIEINNIDSICDYYLNNGSYTEEQYLDEFGLMGDLDEWDDTGLPLNEVKVYDANHQLTDRTVDYYIAQGYKQL